MKTTCLAVLTAVFALCATAAAQPRGALELLGQEIGVTFSAGDSEFAFPGKVTAPAKLALMGLKDVEMDDAVLLIVLPDGNMKLVLPRLNREHILLASGNGGWYPFVATGLGIQLDTPLPAGQRALVLTAELTDTRLLFDRGYIKPQKGDRVELFSPPAIKSLAEVPGYEAFKPAAEGSRWALRIYSVQGEKPLAWEKTGSAPALSKAAEETGVRLDPAIGGGAPAGIIIGGSASGKSTLLGVVTDAAKLGELGLAEAQAGDRVHILARQGGAWRLLLLRPRLEQPVSFIIGDAGEVLLDKAPE